jgi:hypothetical protein
MLAASSGATPHGWSLGGRAPGREVAVPSIGAGVAALLAGWIVDGLLQPSLGTGVTLLLSFAVSTVVFFVARRWLLDLRGR